MAPTTSRAAQRAETGRRILESAQAEFGAKGLQGATVRAIAERAGVDPSLVLQHYGSKDALFAEAVQLPVDDDLGDLGRHLRDVLGVRLGSLPPQTRALVRSMLTSPEAASAMKHFLDERAHRLARAGDGPADGDTSLRATLVVCAILGLTIGRHFLELDGLDDVTGAQLDDVVLPWLTAALDPTDPRTRPSQAVVTGSATGRSAGTNDSATTASTAASENT
ncbi:MAG: TetR family transcriptional regulator [Nocardioidaceae bacterium]|nr:TetR family transcriptional regulator [Nocardioidaceae bacterium]